MVPIDPTRPAWRIGLVYAHEMGGLAGIYRPANDLHGIHVYETVAILFPSLVGCSAMSVHNNWFGDVAVKFLPTRSSVVIRCSRFTYRFLVQEIPRNPRRDMTNATWSRPTWILKPFTNSACTRLTP